MHFSWVSLCYKGYKLLDLNTNKIHISRNVTFHEDIFSFTEDKPVYSDKLFSSDWMNMIPNIPHPQSYPFSMPSEEPNASTSSSAMPSDTSKRVSKPPEYLSDYLCNLTDTDIPYPLAAHDSYSRLSEVYEGYVCALSQHIEHISFTQA